MKGFEGAELQARGNVDAGIMEMMTTDAMSVFYRQFGTIVNEPLPKALLDYVRSMGAPSKNDEVLAARALLEKNVVRPMNLRAHRVRDMKRSLEDPNWLEEPVMPKSEMRKAVLDVGQLTDFANIVGGQTLGYVSLDTRMARSTVRPNSFTLWQALDKSLAWQVVDYWALASSTGGAAPGAAFANYTSVTSGALSTNAGTYGLNNIILKLMLDGRAITTALAAQNNFVNVSEQENMNAALSVLSTANWAGYYGDATFFSNQFNGIQKQLLIGEYTKNIFDFREYYDNYSVVNSWNNEVTLYNLIYQAAAEITSYGTYGHITHAFMSPAAMGSFQYLSTTQLNNVITQISQLQDRAPLVVNGNLIGIQTRVGHIQFPQDLFIDARTIPVQAVSASQAYSSSPTPPTTVTAAVNGATVTGSEWSGAYVASGNAYQYAVAGCDASMNESNVTWTSGATATNVAANGSVTLTITPADTTCVAFRVFRGGLGYSVASSPDPSKVRYIGCVKANGASAVTFVDLNGGSNPKGLTTQSYYCNIPGSSDIFLLDMDPVDLAIDFRMLLPLVRVELFANNLFMPWAVAMIAAIRLRVAQFHGMIRNYVPTNPVFNPLEPNLP